MSKLILSIVIAAFAVGVAQGFSWNDQRPAGPATVVADECDDGFGWDCPDPTPKP